MKILLLFTCFFIVMVTASSVGATTYYFSTSGNDSNTGTSADSPWKSPGRIFNLGTQNKISPGDKFLLKRGDIWGKEYRQAGCLIRLENQAGSEKAPLVIGAYSEGEKPLLAGAGLPAHHLIRLDNCQHIQVQNIHLVGAQFTQRFFLMTGSKTSFIKILGMEFDNTKENQYNPKDPGASRYWGDGVYFREGSGYHHIEVGNCIFTGIGGFKTARLNKADAINVSKPLNHIWIHGNKIYHCNEGVDIAGGTDHIVEDNLIVEITEFQGIKLHSQHTHMANCVVRKNVIIGAKSWGLVLQNISKCKVYNNTISDGGYGAAFIGEVHPNVYKGTFVNNTIENNIFNGLVGIYGTRPKKNIGNANQFTNNCYHNPKHKNLIAADFQPHITAENFKEHWLSQSGVQSEISSDPLFKNATFTNYKQYGDYHLKSTSPCIRGVSSDIGAYEYNPTKRKPCPSLLSVANKKAPGQQK